MSQSKPGTCLNFYIYILTHEIYNIKKYRKYDENDGEYDDGYEI
jgi:hypothetical protein